MWCNQPIWRSEYLCQLGIGQRVKERNSNILASWLADSCVCVCVLCACACACFPSIGTAAHHIAVEFQFSACLFFLLLFLCALLLLLVSICNNSSNSTWLLCFRFILHIYISIYTERLLFCCRCFAWTTIMLLLLFSRWERAHVAICCCHTDITVCVCVQWLCVWNDVR